MEESTVPTIALWEHQYLSSLWETEIQDRRIKNKDDFLSPEDELYHAHMDRITSYEMGWYPYNF